jgi:hypothetical protein
MRTPSLRFLISLAGLCLLPVAVLAGIGDVNSLGWTVLTPSVDSRLVYVSSSTGNDANDGLTPATAKATINGANALIRTGYPDWMLLKRGDTFSQPSLGRWKSGRSAAEPLVMTYYGTSGPRPVILLTGKLVGWAAQARNHVAFVGLDLYRAISDPDSPSFTDASCDLALQFNPGANDAYNVLVEDCRLRYCWLNPQGNEHTYFLRNVHIRRNIVMNAWVHDTLTLHDGAHRIQGMYLRSVVNLTIEENLFHHNGWSEAFADANANMYNHNIYMSATNDGNILVRGNIVSFGAAHGVQLRSGGTAVMNAFVGNSVGMNLGYDDPPPVYFTGQTVVNDNVVTDGRPQVPNDNSDPQSGAIWGFWKQPIDNVTLNNNIVANIRDTRGYNIFPYANMGANEFGSGNIAWDWVNNNEPASDPGWLDPTRDADSFGNAVGVGNWAGFIAEASNRGVAEMPYALSAYAYLDYIRAGFNKSAVTPPYEFDSTPSITTTSLPGGTQGSAYSQTLAATSGNAPLTWSVSAGSLPSGLSLSSGGVISGTPSGSGTSNFTVQVSDADSDTDTQALSIAIAPAVQQFTYLQLEVTGTTNSTEGRIREIDWRVGASEYPNPHYTGASGFITHTGNVGWEAYDGLVTLESYWKLLSSTTGTITLQLASPISPTAVRIRPVNQDRAPSGFIVRGSNNGTSWTVLGTVTGLTPTTWNNAGNDLTFNLSY